jgi:serine/threonine-protein kinase
MQKKAQERSRVATTAIVICSAVAVAAIIFFLVAVFNGFLLNKEKDLVEVPYLVGETYSDNFAAKHKDFTIRLLPQQYDATYAKDQIISQEPAGGVKVHRGTDIWLTVSMGPEPPMIVIDNVIGAAAEDAYKLLESRGFKPLNKKEPSYVYEEGLVTRTDPAVGTELAQGQTVYIYISTGPEIVEETMPNVVGMEVTRAKELMQQLGFKKVRYEKVESRKPENEVIYQSVAKNTLVDVASEIIIHYSEGPRETETPTLAPTVLPETEVIQEETTSYTASFLVPEMDVEYRLDICLNGTKDILASRMITPGTTSVMVEVAGSGTMYFDLYVDGVFVRTQEVGLN